jgi:photosystem II stability/assembly factor-like uncharacterized protein
MNKGYMNNLIVIAPRSLNVSLALLISTLWMGQSILLGFTSRADNAIPAKPPVNTNQAARLSEAYGKLPLSFEANRGQIDPRVKFVTRGSGYALFLTSDEAVLSLSRGAEAASLCPLGPDSGDTATAVGGQKVSTVLRMRLAGSNASPRVAGADELPGKSNYFIGNDPKQWRTAVESFAKVRYEAVYPGVDLVYYGNQRELEYDFIVAAGADPGRIRLSFEGAQSIRIDAQGDLVLSTPAGKIRQHKPTVYQEVSGYKREVSARYVALEKNQIGFEVAHYDRSRPLVIDPVLSYSTYLGGSLGEIGYGIAVDSEGSAYVTGFTQSTNFPTVNPIQASDTGLGAVFVSKLNPSGTALVYSTYLGGSRRDEGRSIAVDAAGNACVTGITASTDFPTANALQPVYGGDTSDAFVSKLSPSGASLIYSTYLGGNSLDEGVDIATDSVGNSYVLGVTGSSNFPVTPGAFQTSAANTFVTKLNPSGTDFIYSSVSNLFRPSAIAVDSAANVYLTGTTTSTDFPLVNPVQSIFKGGTTFKSVNGGSSWGLIDSNPNKFTVLSLAVDPQTPSTIYAGAGSGVHKSTNGGTSWRVANAGLPTARVVESFVINPQTPSTLYARYTDRGIYKSTDGGASWREANNGLSNSFKICLIIDPLNPSTLYAGTFLGVYKSTNGGDNWNQISFGLGSATVHAMAIDPVNPSTLYASTNLGFYRSRDGGNSWFRLNSFFSFTITHLAIDPVTPSTLYALSVTAMKSTDSGISWEPINNGLLFTTPKALVIDPTNSSTLYVASHRNGIFKTTDGGASWAGITANPLNGLVNTIAVDPKTQGTIYAGTDTPSEAYFAMMNPTGSALVLASYLGGSDTDLSTDIAVDASGNIYLTGTAVSSDFPTANALQPSFGGGFSDTFVAKVSLLRRPSLELSTYIGGSGSDTGRAIAVNAAGNIFLAGDTSSPDLPVIRAFQPGNRGFDIFVAQMNATGSALIFSSYLGGQGFDAGARMALGASGSMYVTGHTDTADFPTTPGAFKTTPGVLVGGEAFVSKIEDVSAFDICIQDASNGNILQINSTTGDYQFFDCHNVVTLTGKGIVNVQPCKIELRHTGPNQRRPDRNVYALVDACSKAGSASVQVFSIGMSFTISDSNITNNTCSCVGSK